MCKLHSSPGRPSQAKFLPRDKLVARMAGGLDDAATRHGLVLLTAPAGYGKTWLASQVGRRWGRQGSSVPSWRIQSDLDPGQALRQLCTALAIAHAPDIPADDLIDRLPESLGDNGRALAGLIIDVDGATPGRAVQSLIRRVTMELAVRIRVLVACRNAWLIPVDRLAALWPVQVFGAMDLGFSRAEIAASLRSGMGAAEDWLSLTEGWPILCGGAMQQVLAAGKASLDADGLVGQCGDYLEHEILQVMDRRDARRLMEVSTVNAVEPGILEALDLDFTWSRLASLMESGMPMARGQRDWDRMILHPVFRRFLQRRLKAHEPLLFVALHRRAARFFASAGRFAEALDHAHTTGDSALVAQITDSSGGWRMSLRAGLQVLDTGLLPPEEMMSRFPRAALARIYWQAQTGRIAEARSALDRFEKQGASQLDNDLLSIRAVIGIYRDEEFNETRLEQLARMQPGPTEDEPLLLPGNATLRAAMLNAAGLYERAAQAASDATVEAEAQGSAYVEYYGRLQLALAQHGLGRCDTAIATYARARDLADRIMGENSSEWRLIGLLAAHAHWLAGRNESLELDVAELGDLSRLHSWFEPYWRALEVSQLIARRWEGPAGEDRVIEEFSSLAARRQLPRLDAMVSIARARLCVAQAQLDAAAEHCRQAVERVAGIHPQASARVRASAAVERARIALMQGDGQGAGEALVDYQAAAALLSDGALSIEAGLLDACLAAREGRFDAGARQLARVLADGQRWTLFRPFLDHPQLLVELLDHVREERIALDSPQLAQMTELLKRGQSGQRSLADPATHGLTRREAEILGCLSEGLSSKEMARQLGITEATVKTHRKHLYEKLGVGRRSQAILKGRELGVLG